MFSTRKKILKALAIGPLSVFLWASTAESDGEDTSDPEERENVYLEFPEIASDLKEMLLQWKAALPN